MPPGRVNEPGLPDGSGPLPRLPPGQAKLLAVVPLVGKVGELQFAVVGEPGVPLDGLKLAVQVSGAGAVTPTLHVVCTPSASVTVTSYGPAVAYDVLKLAGLAGLDPVAGLPPGALQV